MSTLIKPGKAPVYDDLQALINDHGAIVAAEGSRLACWSTGETFAFVRVEQYKMPVDFGEPMGPFTRYIVEGFDMQTIHTLGLAADYARATLALLDDEEN